MADLINSVTDIPGWISRQFPKLARPARDAAVSAFDSVADARENILRPVRMIGNAASTASAYGVDLVRNKGHESLGLEPSDPSAHSREYADSLGKDMADIGAGFSGIGRDVGGAFEGAKASLRRNMIESGAKPAPEKVAAAQPAGQQTPGMRIGPQIPGEFGAPQARATVAAPAMRRGRPVAPQAPQGALSGEAIGTDPWEGAVADSANQNGALAAAGQANPADPVAVARKSLQDQYRERMAGAPNAEASLSPQQKAQAELDFWLKMLSSTSQPGARILSSVGDAGQSVLSTVRGDLDRSRQTNEARRKEYMDNVRTEMGYGDKDADNVRADQTQADRRRELDIAHADRQDRLKLIQAQIAQGKWTVLDNGKTGTYVLMDKTTGDTKDTGVKVPAKEAKDNTPAEVRLLQALRDDPKLMDTALAYNKGKQPKEEKPEITEKDIGKLAVDLVKADMSGKTSYDHALSTIRRGHGIGGAPDAIAKPKTDAEFKALPKDAKFVNPKDGKTLTKE